jgi:hypothetical protein
VIFADSIGHRLREAEKQLQLYFDIGVFQICQNSLHSFGRNSESSGLAVSTRKTGGLQSPEGIGLEPITCASSSFQ